MDTDSRLPERSHSYLRNIREIMFPPKSEEPQGIEMRSSANTKIDTALQAVIPVGTFGAAVSFSTLNSAGRNGADKATVLCLAWAFALYLCAAILSLNVRLGVTIDPQGRGIVRTSLRVIALFLCMISIVAATIFLTISMIISFPGWDVVAAGILVLILGAYGSLVTIVHGLTYMTRDHRRRWRLAKLHWHTNQSTIRPPDPSLQFLPHEKVREEIYDFLVLRATYGKARAHLEASSDWVSLEERGRRLAFLAMAFSLTVDPQKDNQVNESILKGAVKYLDANMRKWDDILERLIKEIGEEDWSQSSRSYKMLRMWWLYQAQYVDGGATGRNSTAGMVDAVQEPTGPASAAQATRNWWLLSRLWRVARTCWRRKAVGQEDGNAVELGPVQGASANTGAEEPQEDIADATAGEPVSGPVAVVVHSAPAPSSGDTVR